jgi:hypothetical protein
VSVAYHGKNHVCINSVLSIVHGNKLPMHFSAGKLEKILYVSVLPRYGKKLKNIKTSNLRCVCVCVCV